MWALRSVLDLMGETMCTPEPTWTEVTFEDEVRPADGRLTAPRDGRYICGADEQGLYLREGKVIEPFEVQITSLTFEDGTDPLEDATPDGLLPDGTPYVTGWIGTR